MKIFKSLALVAALAVIIITSMGTSCGSNDVTGVSTGGTKMTAYQYCAQVSTNYGPNWFCGSTQANLNRDPYMPAGWSGYCMVGGANLGTVGYSAHTYSGGAYPVTDYTTQSTLCNELGWNGLGQCSGVATCYRP